MPASGHRSFRFPTAFVLSDLVAAVALVSAPPARAQEVDRIRPVTDAELENPSPTSA